MTCLWEQWEGVSLPGGYTLEKLLGGDDGAAFFQTSRAHDGSRAVVKLMPEAVGDGDAPLGLWQRTRQLRHPNLIEFFDCGRAGHGGEMVRYAVFESSDDTLAAALSRSPLSEVEAREVLDSVIDAMRYLHAQGLVVGALDPGRVIAVADRIKLSTDALRDADASGACREDIRLLGELWRDALIPASSRSAEIAAHAADPDPEARWTLAEIADALEPLPPPVVATAAPTVEPPAVPPPVSEIPITASPLPASPAAVPPHASARVRATPYGFPRWIFLGAAAFLLLILVMNWRRSSDATAESHAATAPPAVEAPLPPPAKAPDTTVPKPSAAAGEDKEMWRVIAFTYGSRDAAARKVHQLNRIHPGLNAAVFVPDRGGYYLVSVGGRMTHEDALRLQRSARGMGLPRDLYVQNYSR